MSDNSKPEDAELIAQLERHGEAQVRLLISSGGFPTQLNIMALKWLSEKDQESRHRNEVSQASQMRTALSAKKAAWIAAIAAIIAAILAAISIAVALR